MDIGDYLIGRFGALSGVDRAVIGIVLGAGIVTPSRIPVAIIEVVVAATDQNDLGKVRVIPTGVMPGRLVSTKDFILRSLPMLGVHDAMVLIERYRFNFLGFCLRMEVGVRGLDLLNIDRFAVPADGSRFNLGFA